MALMSAGRCSPEPSRECSSMFLTIEVGALAVLHDLVEIALQHVRELVDLLARLVVDRGRLEHVVQLVDQLASTATEKLLTKLSGFLISWAMPAVSWPSEASFSVWTRRSCAVRRSSSDCDSSVVRWRNSLNRRAFSMAMTAWLAKLATSSVCLSVKGLTSCRIDRDGADQFVFLEHRHDDQRSRPGEIGQRTHIGIAFDDRAPAVLISSMWTA